MAAAAGDPRAPDAIVIESNETHVLPEDGLRYAGGDAERAPTQIGRRQGGIIASNGTPGFLVHGPYAALPAGIYRVVGREVWWVGNGMGRRLPPGRRTARLGYHPFGPAGGAAGEALAEIVVRSDRDVSDLEVRVWTDPGARVTVSEIAIVPQTIF